MHTLSTIQDGTLPKINTAMGENMVEITRSFILYV